MRKFHTAKEMLKAAAAAGFIIKVWGGDDEPDYVGTDPLQAWEAVIATEEAEITLYDANGTRVKGNWAHLMADGTGCSPQETIVDCSAEGWINDWWEANRDAILA